TWSWFAMNPPDDSPLTWVALMSYSPSAPDVGGGTAAWAMDNEAAARPTAASTAGSTRFVFIRTCPPRLGAASLSRACDPNHIHRRHTCPDRHGTNRHAPASMSTRVISRS